MNTVVTESFLEKVFAERQRLREEEVLQRAEVSSARENVTKLYNSTFQTLVFNLLPAGITAEAIWNISIDAPVLTVKASRARWQFDDRPSHGSFSIAIQAPYGHSASIRLGVTGLGRDVWLANHDPESYVTVEEFTQVGTRAFEDWLFAFATVRLHA